ncbi:MAG: hypothetical protein OM95_16810 [Bdellovibrio sp. ArHS]|uniref:hypothetical protein n=1 Tax=Bdellovibrio sp. ArHS TaxID=1569284 RepID=UPI0005831453|nr:hypothetical protein [Bdellovibrio sp. ArHS]KHD87009.1 MAG: hypothetical protein OM95_16810 [Bdellovibrio sp. ArHS]
MLKKILLLLFLSSSAQAQWALEVDPLAYLAKGYSGHLIYQSSYGFSIDLGAFGMDFPDFAEPHDGFNTRFKGYGVKINYHGSRLDGAYWGVSGGTNEFEIEQTTTYEKQNTTINSVGVQFGYRWGQNGFYISPWIGFDYVIDPPTLQFSSKSYEFPKVNVFPTVHLGYQF